MRPVVAPVGRESDLTASANLQGGLELLLVRRVLPIGEADIPPYTDGLAHERAAGEYGDFTTKLVAIFQEQNAIPVTGEVDEATAEALNGVLRQLGAFDDPEWVVRGQVVSAEGPLDGITVIAHDRDVFFGRDRPGSGQVLGRAVTGPQPDGHETGWFAIPYAADAFSPNDADATPDLVLVLSRDDEALPGARIVRLPDGDILPEETAVGPDELVLGFRPRRVETVRIEHAARPDEPSEYERVWQAVEPLLPSDEEGRAREAYVAAQAADFDEAGHRDVTFIAREAGLPREQVGAYAAAAALARTFRSDVPVAVLYGLHRIAGLTDLRLLAAAPLTTLDAALLRAADAGVIPRLEDGIRTAAVETIHRMGPALVLAEPTHADGATLGRLLAPAIASTDDQADLLRLMTDHTGTATEFWTSLRGHETFGENAGAIRYAVELGTLTSDNAEVADAVRGLRPEATSLAQLAFHLTPDDLRGLLADPGITVPDGAPGVDDAQRRRIYADATAGLLRNAHPSAVTARLVEGLAGDGDDAVVSSATALFLRRAVLEREDFDLATTRLADLAGLADGDEAAAAAVLAQATRVQRLFRISTGTENLTGLLRSPYGSAHAITRAMTGPAFVRGHAAEMGGEREAALTYRRAMAVSALNLVLAVNGHQTAAADTPAGVSAGLSTPPTWAGFFGMSAGQHCEHCRSWLSPAAYLVDLLLFLDRRHGGPEGPTPLAALLARRPDLAHLQLSCENTETALPYVDLVNEVLETYVAVGAVDASAAA